MEDGAEAAQTPLNRTTSTSNSSGSSRRSSDIARKNSRRKHSSQVSTSTLRKRPSGLTEDGSESLTSFPSLSPEASPNTTRSKAGSSKNVSQARRNGQEEDSDATPRKPRANLVETLMNRATFGSSNSRDALFADSPATTTQDVPGALHHASDDHIRRVVARRGVVQLVRQLASDLAQREAEMTTVRLRAEARERELKRMLREVEVSNLDIERRLHRLDEPAEGDASEIKKPSNRNSIGSVGDLVGEALDDDLSARDEESFLTEGLGIQTDRQATIRASRGSNQASRSSSVESGTKGWMNYFLGGSNTVRKQQSGTGLNVQDRGAKTTAPAARRKGLDENLFQPPADAREDGTSMVRSESGTSDATRRASRSSWTMKLFAGGTSQKETEGQSTTRGRSGTTASETLRNLREASQSSRHTTDATTGTARPAKGGQRRSLHALSISNKQIDARSISSMPIGSPTSTNPPENLGPVEMDAILPHGSRPPTLTPTYEVDNQSDVLTDRFGFIYDQRRRKREAEALARTRGDQPLKGAFGLSSDIPEINDADSVARSSNLASGDEAEGEEVAADTASGPVKRWQDYLSIPAFPSTELLSQTPTLDKTVDVPTTRPSGKKTLRRMPTFGEEVTSPNPAPSPSTITAGKAEIAKPILSGSIAAESTHSETEPVKLLLAQLTELHDKLQREKTVKWNEFMRKVRAERRREGENAAAIESRTKHGLDLPEASIADGEIIGISSLGHKGKVGRAKYREFKSLVLGGIPIIHRAKVWSECSGSNALRIPGYYQDLVTNDDHADPTVLTQIDLDINRTLTDNVFFRSGPGVNKLKEVLIAYSQHNTEVGYCQGLNMIVGALLLIMPTTEDVFWILASLVENILPRRYYDNSLLASRADQQVLRSYVAELLPKLSAHLDELGVELEALTFQWFLSIFTDCLTAEALYRVWDVLLCLASDDGNGGSTFLFQVALALLKLNEQQLLACETPGEVYTYLGGEITNHAISIDGLIRASEGLKSLVKRKEVEERRRKWVLIEEETIREREAIRNGKILNTRKGVTAQA